MAVIVVERGADRQVRVPGAAVGDGAGRIARSLAVGASSAEITGPHVAIVVLEEAVLRIEPDAGELVSMMKLTTPETASEP